MLGHCILPRANIRSDIIAVAVFINPLEIISPVYMQINILNATIAKHDFSSFAICNKLCRRQYLLYADAVVLKVDWGYYMASELYSFFDDYSLLLSLESEIRGNCRRIHNILVRVFQKPIQRSPGFFNEP